MATLTLTVLRCPDFVSAEQRQVNGGELTIGRGAECDWALPDPGKSLSRRHCTLEFLSGAWQVRDLSSNGTVVNYSTQALGRDQVQALRSGDRLRLGDYEIEVRIDDSPPGAEVSPFGSSAGAGAAPFGAGAGVAPFGGGAAVAPFGGGAPVAPFGGGAPVAPFGAGAGGAPFGGGAGGAPFGGGAGGAPLGSTSDVPGLFGGEPRRPAGFGGARVPGLDDSAGFGAGAAAGAGYEPARSDHVASSADAFLPPAVRAPGPSSGSGVASNIVPDDWLEDLIGGSSPSPSPVALRAPAPPAAPAFAAFEQHAPAPAARRAGPPDDDPFGGDPLATSPPPMPPVQSPVAPAAAYSASGPTMIADPGQATPRGGGNAHGLVTLMAGGDLTPDLAPRAVADPDEALRHAGALLRASVAGLRALLIGRWAVKREFRIEQTVLRTRENNPIKFAASDEQALSALLDPRGGGLTAVKDSIADLSSHQVAVMAATQAAARALLEQLDPAKLEADDSGGGLLPGAAEKRLWQAYKRSHAKLQAQFEDDFESAFGKAFARAYEQAVNTNKGKT